MRNMEVEEYLTVFHQWLDESREGIAAFGRIQQERARAKCRVPGCVPARCAHAFTLQHEECFETSAALDHLLGSLRTKIDNHDYVFRMGLN